MDWEDYSLKKNMGWQHKEIAKSWGLGVSTVWKYLPISLPETSIPEKSIRFIESSLVGDGSLVPKGTKVQFSMTGANKRYIEWVRNNLIGQGFKCTNESPFLWEKESSGFKKDCDIFSAKTRVCSGLCFLRNRWYPRGQKIMPLDFIWDQEALEVLITEDGTREKSGYVVYWGAKSDNSFESLKLFVKNNFECEERKRHKTGGRNLVIHSRFRLFPGYEYKAG